METIKRIDTGERIVNLIENNGKYIIRIISNLGVGCKVYKSKYYANLGYSTFKDYPLDIIYKRYVD